MMKKLVLFILLPSSLALFYTCKKKPTANTSATCSDGILNQDETAVDCGGKCSKCPSCSDGIQNQGEAAVDCGGPCGKCPIFYPDSGIYGLNILRKSSDTITLNGNKWYSAFAIAAPQSSIRVRFTNPQGGGLNWYFTLGLGKWILNTIDNNTQDLKTANTAGYADAEFGFQPSSTGTAKIEIFENGATTATRKIVLYWFP